MRGVVIQPRALLTTALGGEWLASRPDRFTPKGNHHSTPGTGDRISPKAGVHTVDDGNCLVPAGRPLPRVQHVPLHYTAWAVPGPAKHNLTVFMRCVRCPCK